MKSRDRRVPAIVFLSVGVALAGACSDSGSSNDPVTARYVLTDINGGSPPPGARIRERSEVDYMAILTDTLTLLDNGQFTEAYQVLCTSVIDDECTLYPPVRSLQVSGTYTIADGTISFTLSAELHSVASGAAGTINLSNDALYLISPPDLDTRAGSEGPDESNWTKLGSGG